jgi:hypothetical protein
MVLVWDGFLGFVKIGGLGWGLDGNVLLAAGEDIVNVMTFFAVYASV